MLENAGYDFEIVELSFDPNSRVAQYIVCEQHIFQHKIFLNRKEF